MIKRSFELERSKTIALYTLFSTLATASGPIIANASFYIEKNIDTIFITSAAVMMASAVYFALIIFKPGKN